MPRPPRPIDEGLVYHVINRGKNRARVFFRRQDYATFLEALRDLKQLRPLELYGYTVGPYEALARTAAARQGRWSTYVHKMPAKSELEAIGLSTQRRLPFGAFSLR